MLDFFMVMLWAVFYVVVTALLGRNLGFLLILPFFIYLIGLFLILKAYEE